MVGEIPSVIYLLELILACGDVHSVLECALIAFIQLLSDFTPIKIRQSFIGNTLHPCEHLAFDSQFAKLACVAHVMRDGHLVKSIGQIDEILCADHIALTHVLDYSRRYGEKYIPFMFFERVEPLCKEIQFLDAFGFHSCE